MTDPKPIVPAPPKTFRHAVVICLSIGAVALASGCLLGFEGPGDRVSSLALLGCGVVAFAVALVLQLKTPTAPGADLPPTHGATPTRAVTPAPAALLVPGSTTDGPAPRPIPVPVLPPAATRPAAVLSAPKPPLAGTVLDVPALMRLPLSDLLLAALCKDPQGARRIFAQMALHGDTAGATVMPSPGVRATPSPVEEEST